MTSTVVLSSCASNEACGERRLKALRGCGTLGASAGNACGGESPNEGVFSEFAMAEKGDFDYGCCNLCFPDVLVLVVTRGEYQSCDSATGILVAASVARQQQ